MGKATLKMERVPYVPLTISRILLYYVAPLAVFLSLRLTLIPNPVLAGGSGFLLFLALGLGATVIHLGRAGTARTAGGESTGAAVFRFLALVVLYVFLAWALVGKWLPWAYTEIFGAAYSREVVVTSSHRKSRRSCDTKLHTPLMRGTWPNYICADGKGVGHVRAFHMIEVRLHGRKTFLGATVDRIEWIGWVVDGPRVAE